MIADSAKRCVAALWVLSACASTGVAATRTWNSGWDTQPVNGDDVVIAGGDLTWDASLPTNVASWLQPSTYAEIVTFDTRFPGQGSPQVLHITGDCIISNGTWKHPGNTSGDEVYRLRVHVGGDLVVGDAARIDADTQGTAWQDGLCGHGGLSVWSGTDTYGSITSPTNVGDGIYHAYGGGAIYLTVTGDSAIEGTVSSMGANNGDVNQCGGAGGSIYLTTGTIQGSGTLSANGGYGSGRGGGGGRIAVILTSGTDFGNMKMTAYGGGTSARNGAAGTVYQEKATDAAGKGELIVDNNNDPADNLYAQATELNTLDAVSYEFARITVTNAGVLGVGPDDTLIMTTTVVSGDSEDENDGIRVAGGTLTVPATLAVSNYFIQVSAAGSTFDPSTSLTIGTGGGLLVDKPHSLSGNLTIQSGGTLSHWVNDNPPTYGVDLTIGRDLTVEAGGEVNVDRKGYPKNTGPGKEGSHGGRGSRGSAGSPYGSITEPTTHGSGGGVSCYPGGGTVRLVVTGATSLDGLMTSDGGPSGDNNQNPAAGGSIWLTTSNLTGNGTIKANGGIVHWAGGGGRVAVTLTGSDSFGGVDFQAYGGDNGNADGGAGTVYLRTQDQSASNGVLIVRNMPGGVSSVYTEISSLVSNAWVGEVLIGDNGRLRLRQDQGIRVSRVWSNGNAFVADRDATVEFFGTNRATVYGSSTFARLVCTNVSKQIDFEAAQTTAVTNDVVFSGPSNTGLLLRSTSTGVQWLLDVDSATAQTVRSVDAKDSDARPGANIAASFSRDSGNNSNWTFAAVGKTNVWIGGTSSAWAEDANWSLGRPPADFDGGVIFSNNCTHYTTLPNDKTFGYFEMKNPSFLLLGGFDLTVRDNAVIAGTLAATGAERLTFEGDVDWTSGTFTQAQSTVWLAGSGVQAMTSASQTCYRLTVTNSGRTVTFVDAASATYFRNESVSLTFSDGVTAGDYRAYPTDGPITQTFAAASTSTIRDFYLLGSEGKTNWLESTSGGSLWTVGVSRVAHVTHTHVTDSDATPGITIYPVGSASGGNNNNWVFEEWLTWDGSEDSDFSEANNWTPATAPDGSKRLNIDGNYATMPVISGTVSVRALHIGAGMNPSALRINGSLTVGEDLNVLGSAIVTSDVPVTVTNDMSIAEGAWLTHSPNGTTEDHKFTFTIGGNLALDAGAEIDTGDRGFAKGAGPGDPGSHGGRGYRGKGTGPTYGSIIRPIRLGSGGDTDSDKKGGGAVYLDVAGSCTVNGTISANALPHGNVWAICGAGGSVCIEAASLSGSGTVEAIGGMGAGHGGGGGRVSVVLSGGGGVGSVTMKAHGGDGNGDGGAGTVYRRSGGTEQVIMDNHGINGSIGNTELPPGYGGGEGSFPFPAWEFADNLGRATVIVTNGTRMKLTADIEIGSLIVATVTEWLDLGAAPDTLTLRHMTINGTLYTSAGRYTTNDWNGYATPSNVSGDGTILIEPAGSVLFLR